MISDHYRIPKSRFKKIKKKYLLFMDDEDVSDFYTGYVKNKYPYAYEHYLNLVEYGKILDVTDLIWDMDMVKDDDRHDLDFNDVLALYVNFDYDRWDDEDIEKFVEWESFNVWIGDIRKIEKRLKELDRKEKRIQDDIRDIMDYIPELIRDTIQNHASVPDNFKVSVSRDRHHFTIDYDNEEDDIMDSAELRVKDHSYSSGAGRIYGHSRPDYEIVTDFRNDDWDKISGDIEYYVIEMINSME